MNQFVKQEKTHEPVLVEEVINVLGLTGFAHSKYQARKYIDATLGGGGMSLEIISRGGNVLGIDSDESMLEVAKERLEKESLARPTPDQDLVWGSFKLIHGNFANIKEIAGNVGFLDVDGIIFDLGISNLHYEDNERGFSFKNLKADLDMRLNPKTQNVTASDLLNSLRFDQLVELFSVVLGKKESKKLTAKIILAREIKKIDTVGDFLNILGSKYRYNKKIHPASLPFLALRIAVGTELDNLNKALSSSFELLNKGGKLAVISFHSAEDRLVKRFFKEKVLDGNVKLFTKKPIIAKEEEILRNPKARSAKLRVLIKI